jgi:hypothetical protein
MAAISLFWYTNMAAVTSDENDLYTDSLVSPDTNTYRSGAMLAYKFYPLHKLCFILSHSRIFKYSGYSETVKLGGVTNLVKTTSA